MSNPKDQMIKYLIPALVLLLLSCGQEQVLVPKPRMFPRVDFPEKHIRQFDLEGCPYLIEFPDYATLERDSTFLGDAAPNLCWFNLNLPPFNGTIHFSYYPIDNRASFDKMVQDAFKLTGKHHIKADYVEEERIRNKNGVDGFIFRVTGPSASPMQFYLTDSTNHFIRGALYFNDQVRPDSMQPVYQFVEKDLYGLISTFEWKE